MCYLNPTLFKQSENRGEGSREDVNFWLNLKLLSSHIYACRSSSSRENTAQDMVSTKAKY